MEIRPDDLGNPVVISLLQEHLEVRVLYQRYGFALCEPFAHYLPDPNSVFMAKILRAE